MLKDVLIFYELGDILKFNARFFKLLNFLLS